jgi:NAD(P) transhydrogenase subunit alpha
MYELLQFIFDYREAIFIILLSVFLGIEVISHVPSVLHTPLMSGANAIHGVVIIGAIIVMGHAENTLSMVLGFLAVILGLSSPTACWKCSGKRNLKNNDHGTIHTTD